MDISIYLSIYLSVYLYIYLSFYLSIYLSIYFLSIYFSIYLCIYLSIHLSIFLSIYLSIWIYRYIYIYTFCTQKCPLNMSDPICLNLFYFDSVYIYIKERVIVGRPFHHPAKRYVKGWLLLAPCRSTWQWRTRKKCQWVSGLEKLGDMLRCPWHQI